MELDGFHIFGALQAVMGEDNLFFLLGDQALDGHGRTLPAARLLEGLTSKEIGRVLHISHRTVEIYRARLMRKYGASTTADLVHKLLTA